LTKFSQHLTNASKDEPEKNNDMVTFFQELQILEKNKQTKKRRFCKSNRMILEAFSHKPSNKAEVNEIHFLRVHQQPYWY